MNCSSGGLNRLVIIMDYCKDSLATEIEQRKIQSYFYDESEIWYLLERVMMVENDLMKNYNRVHGDIQPNNILVPDDESIKFIDPTIINYKLDAFSKNRLRMDTSPLSPELMNLIKYNLDNQYDQQAAEVWSIGIFCQFGLYSKNIRNNYALYGKFG